MIDNTSNNHIKLYKNFNMGTEIDIAGTFIYNGIKELDSMESLHYESEVFSFLYPISVGIERLQKVLIVLAENISEDEIEEFEKSLITHSHQDLHNRIKKHVAIEFNSSQNSFLQLLNNFYKRCRYERFNVKGKYNLEKTILIDYIKKNLSDEATDEYCLSSRIKEFLGKIIGAIARKYYDGIYKLACNQNLYTYELRSGSKAEKIFLSQLKKDSLQEQVVNEQISLKEFLVFLINTKTKNNFYKFIKKIEPLEFDMALANSYLESICKGNIPSDLVDEVEYLYDECGYSKDRIEIISCIGNDRVDFDFGVIVRLKKEFELLNSKEHSCEKFVCDFCKIIEDVEDKEVLEMLDNTLKICNEFRNGDYNTKIKQDKFVNKVKIEYKNFIKMFFDSEYE